MFDWIQNLANYITNSLLNLSGTHLGNAFNFFIYDSIKIFILLILIVHLMTLINHFLPIEKIRDFLAKNKFYGFDYFLSALFGAVTPFCSCSSIPMFVGFLKAGIPLGITFTFLITSPLINEVAVALFIGLFGWKVTTIYVASGMILGILGGFVIGKLKMENQVAEFVWKNNGTSNEIEREEIQLRNFVKQVSKDSFALVWKIMPYVILGVAIGGVIHGFIPTGFFEKYITKENPFAVPIAVILGIPMYANATSVIPIIQALIAKGIPLGTGLAFMMAVVGLSLPEFLILKKVMKMKLLLTFFGVVGFFIIILGYFFNLVL
ncbi:MAG: permease [Candidatus Gracilibacteria bacterium]|nr:permease [Candidatus Gracilibacteria bacterium]